MSEPTRATPLSFTVDGRSYQPRPALSFAQTIYVTGCLEAAGLPDLFREMREADDDTVAERVLRRVLATGQVLPLLAGFVVEVPTEGLLPKWDLETARLNAIRFGETENPAEHAALTLAVIGLLTDFFASGLDGSSISPSASSSPTSRTSRTTPGAPATTSPPGPSGADSSTSLPTMTPSGSQ